MNHANEQLNDQPMSASIVIVNYNGGDAILDCLDSVLAHIEPDVEVIVVDNASVDGSPETIKSSVLESAGYSSRGQSRIWGR